MQMLFTSLLTVDFADSFVRLFTDMSPWCIGLFVLGIIFCVIEVFMPGFGFFGVTGILLIIVGMVLRLVMGGDVWMLVYMLTIFTVLFVLLFFVMSRLIVKGKLSKTAIFSVGTAVPEDRTEGTKDYTSLVGKVVVAQTVLRPVGKAKIDNVVVDVVARDGFIAELSKIKVVEVEGQRIVVIEEE